MTGEIAKSSMTSTLRPWHPAKVVIFGASIGMRTTRVERGHDAHEARAALGGVITIDMLSGLRALPTEPLTTQPRSSCLPYATDGVR